MTDEPEVKGYWLGGGGGQTLSGLRWTYDIIAAAPPVGGKIIWIMGGNP